MRTIPSTWREQIDTPHAASPWVFCFRIPLVQTEVVNLWAAITTHREVLAIPPFDYKPVQLTMSPIEESKDNGLGTIDLGISNRPRVLAKYLDRAVTGQTVIGKRVTGALVLVSDTTQQHEITWDVVEGHLTDESAVLRLSVPNLADIVVPSDKYRAVDCRHPWGGDRCGYLRNATAAFATCPKTYGACVERGNDMVYRGLPRLQPERFGGFLGISL